MILVTDTTVFMLTPPSPPATIGFFNSTHISEPPSSLAEFYHLPFNSCSAYFKMKSQTKMTHEYMFTIYTPNFIPLFLVLIPLLHCEFSLFRKSWKHLFIFTLYFICIDNDIVVIFY